MKTFKINKIKESNKNATAENIVFVFSSNILGALNIENPAWFKRYFFT